MKKILIFLLASIFLITLFYGFYFSWPHWMKGLKSEGEYGFLENLLSEGIGLILEAAIVTIVVSFIINQSEIKKWKYIRGTLTDSLIRLASESIHQVSSEIYEKIRKTPILWDPLDTSVQKVLENNHRHQKKEILAFLKDNLQQIENLKTQYLISMNYELMKFTEEIKKGIEEIGKSSKPPITTNCTIHYKKPGEIGEYEFETESGAYDEVILRSLKLREDVLSLKNVISNALNNELKNLISKDIKYLTMLNNIISHGEMTANLLLDYKDFFNMNKTFKNFTSVKFRKVYQSLLH